jgi:hypothetical protein
MPTEQYYLNRIDEGIQTLIAAAAGAVAGTYTNRSLAITTGGTSEQLMAANADRINFVVQNPSSEIESLFINFGAAAHPTSGNSIELAPGGYWIGTSTDAVNVVAATTGHKVIAKELVPV